MDFVTFFTISLLVREGKTRHPTNSVKYGLAFIHAKGYNKRERVREVRTWGCHHRITRKCHAKRNTPWSPSAEENTRCCSWQSMHVTKWRGTSASITQRWACLRSWRSILPSNIAGNDKKPCLLLDDGVSFCLRTRVRNKRLEVRKKEQEWGSMRWHAAAKGCL